MIELGPTGFSVRPGAPENGGALLGAFAVQHGPDRPWTFPSCRFPEKPSEKKNPPPPHVFFWPAATNIRIVEHLRTGRRSHNTTPADYELIALAVEASGVLDAAPVLRVLKAI